MNKGKEMEMDESFKDACFAARAHLLRVEAVTLKLVVLAASCYFTKEDTDAGDDAEIAAIEKILYGERRSEMVANVKLAYRHIEDARMRIGKAIQAFDDGESCYPK